MATTPGADGLVFTSDRQLAVGGQGNAVYKVNPLTGSFTTVTAGGSVAYHMMVSPNGTIYSGSDTLPGGLASFSKDLSANGTSHALTGDDTEIDSIAWDSSGHAFYTASSWGGNGSFGSIDLKTFTTTRLISNLPAAHGMTFDLYTGNLILVGADHVTQIDPANPTVIVSDAVFAGNQFDQLASDGKGHLFIADNNHGNILFLDITNSKLVGSPDFSSIQFLANSLDDLAPLSGPGAASPTLTTTPSSTSVTLGTTSPTLKDTATLSGGYNVTGTITFTLYLGATLVDTETATVTGIGTYTTPTGYTLPTTGTVAGTYQWNATYSGDANNTRVSDISAVNEQVTVSPASPTIVTTASPAVTLPTGPPGAVTLSDSAVVSGAYNATGALDFVLKLGNTQVYSTSDPLTGDGNGTYSASYTLPTTGTVAGTYTWTVSYAGDLNNNRAVDQGGTAALAYDFSTPPGVLGTSQVYHSNGVDITAYGFDASGTATALYGKQSGFHETGLGLANESQFEIPTHEFIQLDLGKVNAYSLLHGNTSVSLTVNSVQPGESFQIFGSNTLGDLGTALFASPLTTEGPFTLPIGPSSYRYIGIEAVNGNVLLTKLSATAEQTVVSPASPSIVTTASPAVTLAAGSPGSVTLSDSAVLSGGYHETGSLVFTLSGPGAFSYSQTVTVSGNGTYSASDPVPTSGMLAGTYTWTVSYYSGDGNNNGAVDQGGTAEQTVVITAPDVDITKTTSTPTVNAGGTASFTVTVFNEGTGAATNVSFSDPLPAGLGKDVSWSISTQTGPTATAFSISGGQLLFSPTTLNAGDTYTVTVTATVFAADTGANFTGTLVNTATVTATNETTDEQDQSATATVNITAPDVDITKTTSTPTVNAGGTASFTVTVFNEGTGAAAGVRFSDPLPAGAGTDITWSISSQDAGNDFSINTVAGVQYLVFGPSTLAAGESHTVTLTGTVSAADAPTSFTGTLVNTATVTANNETTDEQDQSATATVNITAPDVDITKTTRTPTVNAGGTASFTVTVFNEGTGAAAGVSFSDPLPAGAGTDIVWSISGASDGFSISGTTAGSQSLVFSATSLAAGESHTVTITGTVSAADAPTSFTGTLVNTATVTANNETTDEQNQKATATITVNAPGPPIIPLSFFLPAAAGFPFLPAETLRPPFFAGFTLNVAPTPFLRVEGAKGAEEEKLGTITGEVFWDDNGNGVLDPGEKGIPNQMIILEREGMDGQTEHVATAWSDSTGWYTFLGVKPGLYRVRTRLTPDWVQTNKADYEGGYTVTMRGSFHAVAKDFGAIPTSARIGMTLPSIPAGEDADSWAIMSIAAHRLTDTVEPRDMFFEEWMDGANGTIGGPADRLPVYAADALAGGKGRAGAEDVAWLALALTGAIVGVGHASLRAEGEEEGKPERDETT